MLKMSSQVCGNSHHNKHGLRYSTTPKVPKNQSSKHYRRYISDHHKTIDDTYAFSKAVQLQVQGQWTRWINHVQQDFSWASLMAMSANLTSFCLVSTYDTLPSPTNLKRWRITTEAMCTLCRKDVCTTAHILGACKVALQQGRYTFRHDTLLHQVIEALQTFISNIKEAVPISAKSSVMFVKKGAKVPRKRTPPVGILHCVRLGFLADLNSNYCFPVHIVFTQLRSDITIFSNSWRKVILIELTCPCEETMESWHSTKVNKYLALKTVIKSNGWCVELFAVEVGARRYCSKSVLCCFKKLGFNNTRIRNTIKKLSESSMECSFCMWLARNNKHWSPAANCKLNDPSKETCNSPSLSCPKQTNKSVSNTKSICPVGFINKGSNSCYANSILQILSVAPNLWSRVPSESNTLLPAYVTSYQSQHGCKK